MVVVTTNVPHGVEVHQLLCGREIARDHKRNMLHQMAVQMANYVYLVADIKSHTAVVVDPAWDTDGVFAFAEELGLKLSHALFTHRHFDHTGGRVPKAMIGTAQDIRLPGLYEFLEQGISCHVGEKDASFVAKQSGVPLSNISTIGEGSIVEVSESIVIKCLATPGHTPGSVCFSLGKILFTGDTLFIGSCGRVDLPESDVTDMMGSLNRLSKLPADTIVLPGHNYAMEAHSSIAGERETNGMMMQAMARSVQQSQGRNVSVEPIAAHLPLPDYLNVARRIFNRFETRDISLDGTCLCDEHEVAHHKQFNAKQLESHF